MIKYVKGNLLSVSKGVIVHGCNSFGAMGAGVALAIKNMHPFAFESYAEFCANRGYVAADLLGRLNGVAVSDDLWVINAITQAHTGNDGSRYVSYDAVDDVMRSIANSLPLDTSINMPKIGAGLGGGDWNVIEAIINHRLKDHDVTVWVI